MLVLEDEQDDFLFDNEAGKTNKKHLNNRIRKNLDLNACPERGNHEFKRNGSRRIQPAWGLL